MVEVMLTCAPHAVATPKNKKNKLKSKDKALFVMVFKKFKVYQIGFCAQLGT
jgi:hypothetical protein